MIQQLIKKSRLAIAGLVIGVIAASSPAGTALAGTTTPAATTGADTCAPAAIVAFPHWYDNGLCKDGKIVSPNEVGGIPKFVTIIAANIVTIMLMVVGYVSLAFIIWGGFKYMYSGDNASGTSAAKKTILNAVIGLILSIMSVAIVKVIAGAIA